MSYRFYYGSSIHSAKFLFGEFSSDLTTTSKKFDCSESCEVRKFQAKCHINLVKNQRKVPEWRHIGSSDSKYCSSLRRWRLRWHSSVYSYTTLFVNMKLSPIHVPIFMMIFNLSEIIDRRDEQLIIWFYQVIFYMQTS